MSIEEYKNELVAEYKCSDPYGEMCDGDCNECSRITENNLNKLENLVRTDERQRFAESLREYICTENCGKHKCTERFDECVWVGYIDKVLEKYEKEQKNED